MIIKTEHINKNITVIKHELIIYILRMNKKYLGSPKLNLFQIISEQNKHEN